MPIGPSSRPQEPLHVITIALALAVAAFSGGALGVVWQWLSGEDVPEDPIEAAMEPVEEKDEEQEVEEEEEDEEEELPAPPRPSPAAPPQPSPNAR